ncbi:hypothetical protein BXZ70DRAFT_957447 [Cristinia sonorae]|uniref:RING-CH-type domain-containing protein n=1 Tax=Cristinia sonorae TaxID=1940300 RepID=A0A8K0XKW8_9AGAR|nr:hypothetical protein BXZ70DRAFT_957447 [Cristinia sonorae]
MTDTQNPPTINDLRVKLCYICREEEFHDKPAEPTVQWVHPCNCTLVAHESCLLSWIQSAQQDSKRAPNALKCPQCGAQYELESEKPLTLRILNSFNSVLQHSGKLVTVVGTVGLAGACCFGVYVACTSYGAYALQEFIGKELYDILLTDDPSNWPYHAYINLPLIPISLIFSRTSFFQSFPLPPLFIAWATSQPVTTTETLMRATWNPQHNVSHSFPFAPIMNWPPSPLMASILFPMVNRLYRKYFTQFRHWVMGTQPAPRPPVRRIVWDFNEDGPGQIRVGINAAVEEANGRPRRGGQQREGNRAGAEENNHGEQDQDEQNADPAAVAERTIRVTSGSLGCFIGGALLIPSISNFMGSLLLRLSKYSSLLRWFLAIRPGKTSSSPVDSFAAWFSKYDNGNATPMRQFILGLRTATYTFFGGTKVFAESDPVWWRNYIGLGIFVLGRDCLNLLHLYLTKREIETRRIKSRSFAGIDIHELDLINPPRPAKTDTNTPA